MRYDRAAQKSFMQEFTAKDTWVPPACGVVASILVSVIGRAVQFEYRSEAGIGTFLLVASLVRDYRSGLLKEKPIIAIAASLASGTLGAAIMFWLNQ